MTEKEGEQSKMLDQEAKGAEEKATSDGDENNIKLKKELGLMEGVAIILGIIIGSGEQEAHLSLAQDGVYEPLPSLQASSSPPRA